MDEPDLTTANLPDDSDPPALARRVVRGALWVGAAQYGALTIGLVKVAILARLIDPGVYGVLDLAVVYVSYFTLFRMLLQPIVVADPAGHPARLTTQWIIETGTMLTGFVVAGIAYLAAPGIVGPAVWTAIGWLLGGQLVVSLTSTPLYMLKRDIRQREIAALTLAGVLVSLATSVWLAWQGHPLAALLVDAALPTAVLGVGSAVIVRWRPRRAWDAEIAKDVWGFGWTLWTNGLLGKIQFQFDDWLVGTLGSTKALGFYGRAYTLAKMPMDVFGGIIAQLAPAVYAQSRAVSRAELSKYYGLLTWALVRVVAISSVLVLGATDEIVRIILGDKWLHVVPLARLMFLFILGRPLFQNNAQLLEIVRQEKRLRTLNLIQAVVLLVIGPPLVWQWGGAGASVAVSVMMVVGVVATEIVVGREVDVNRVELFALPVVVMVALSPAVYGLGLALGLPALPSLVIKGLAAVVVAGGLTWLLERQRVESLIGLVREQWGKG